jgi:hypothetical protein
MTTRSASPPTTLRNFILAVSFESLKPQNSWPRLGRVFRKHDTVGTARQQYRSRAKALSSPSARAKTGISPAIRRVAPVSRCVPSPASKTPRTPRTRAIRSLSPRTMAVRATHPGLRRPLLRGTRIDPRAAFTHRTALHMYGISDINPTPIASPPDLRLFSPPSTACNGQRWNDVSGIPSATDSRPTVVSLPTVSRLASTQGTTDPRDR